MTLRIRAARPEDHAGIARVSLAAYEADGQVKAENPYAATLADVESRAAAGEMYVAVDGDDTVVGAVTFVLPGSPFAELSGPGEAEFRMLAVDPAAQGQGVGEALARACVRRAGELGCDAVVICTRDFALPAQRLYSRLGFTRAPELDWSPMPGVQLLGLRLPLKP